MKYRADGYILTIAVVPAQKIKAGIAATEVIAAEASGVETTAADAAAEDEVSKVSAETTGSLAATAWISFPATAAATS